MSPPVPASGSVPLEVRAVTKRFGASAALAAVELRVEPGTIVGLVGPNGSGKTTLLRSAAGLTVVDSGSILVSGSPAGSIAARSRSALVPDEPSGFEELSGTEFIALTHALWGVDGDAARRAEIVAAAFGLGDRLDQRLGTLSRGLRRQVSAVAAFSLDVPLILVDEATATLDPEAVVVLHEVLAARARSGCGVLLATQDLHFAGEACDEIVLLHRGVVIERGAPVALRHRHGADSLEGVFLAALGDGLLRTRVRDAFRAL